MTFREQYASLNLNLKYAIIIFVTFIEKQFHFRADLSQFDTHSFRIMVYLIDN